MPPHRLGTSADSSATLARGMDLANQPLAALLQLKEEPLDEEEKQMQDEVQAGQVNNCMFPIPLYM